MFLGVADHQRSGEAATSAYGGDDVEWTFKDDVFFEVGEGLSEARGVVGEEVGEVFFVFRKIAFEL